MLKSASDPQFELRPLQSYYNCAQLLYSPTIIIPQTSGNQTQFRGTHRFHMSVAQHSGPYTGNMTKHILQATDKTNDSLHAYDSF